MPDSLVDSADHTNSQLVLGPLKKKGKIVFTLKLEPAPLALVIVHYRQSIAKDANVVKQRRHVIQKVVSEIMTFAVNSSVPQLIQTAPFFDYQAHKWYVRLHRSAEVKPLWPLGDSDC